MIHITIASLAVEVQSCVMQPIDWAADEGNVSSLITGVLSSQNDVRYLAAVHKFPANKASFMSDE